MLVKLYQNLHTTGQERREKKDEGQVLFLTPPGREIHLFESLIIAHRQVITSRGDVRRSIDKYCHKFQY